MKKGRKFLLPFCLVLLLFVTGMFYMRSIVSHADAIPEDSIKNQLEKMYNGEVNDLLLHDDIYGATLTREGSVYEVRVDGATGNVLSMVLKEPSKELVLKQKEAAERAKKEKDKSSLGKTEEVPAQSAPEEHKPQPETPKPAPVQPKPQPKPQEKPQPKPPVNKPAPQKTVLLTEQQAVQIALRQLNGEVDDVDFVKTSEGGYYLVEIEIDVDDGPDEATYQIHAISGKVMSVTWDD
ncbi:PepSY domain-containing protein [Sporosarcina sp. D27]|uniref:PepSY domain-containing protein n=1 Tax=Sporosarcina sp. D27 TaxID=1382305 RepID=UPI0004723615|nr:PepSY domain-containing protein [Sporosarcina sp. D27]